MDSFEDATNSLFEQDDALRRDWTPDELPEREDELSQIHSVLEPAARGQSPLNAFIYGKTGQGKTAAMKVKLRQLQEFANGRKEVSITSINLSCNNLTKSYHVAAHLLKTLREPGAAVPRGHDLQTLYDKIYDRFNDIGGTIIVVLDEIDAIGSDDSILYEFPRARNNGYINEDVRLAVIGISNDFSFRDNLSPKVKDSLCDEEIEFAPYDANQLRKILKRRADIALCEGSLSSDVIPLCAAFAARENGSARLAIKYLAKAAQLADSEGDDVVDERHVRRAESEIEQEFIAQGMRNLTIHDHLALCAVAALEADSETPARTRDVYDRYVNCCDLVGTDPLVQRRMRDRLTDLDLHSIIRIREQNAGRHGGNLFLYELDVNLEQTLEVLSGIESLSLVATEIRAAR